MITPEDLSSRLRELYDVELDVDDPNMDITTQRGSELSEFRPKVEIVSHFISLQDIFINPNYWYSSVNKNLKWDIYIFAMLTMPFNEEHLYSISDMEGGTKVKLHVQNEVVSPELTMTNYKKIGNKLSYVRFVILKNATYDTSSVDEDGQVKMYVDYENLHFLREEEKVKVLGNALNVAYCGYKDRCGKTCPCIIVKENPEGKCFDCQEEEADLHDRLAIEEEKLKPAKDELKFRIKFYAERELEIHGILKRYLKMDLLVPLHDNANYDDLKARELAHVRRQQEYTTLPLPTNIFIKSIARRELVYRGGGLTLPQSRADREYLRTCHIPSKTPVVTGLTLPQSRAYREYLRTCHIPPKTPVVTTSANTSRKRKRGT